MNTFVFITLLLVQIALLTFGTFPVDTSKEVSHIILTVFNHTIPVIRKYRKLDNVSMHTMIIIFTKLG